MTIHSAADHGYFPEPAPPTVRIGDTFRMSSASGIYEARVLRPHRDLGYFETVLDHWISGYGVEHLTALVGSIDIVSRREILKAMRAA